MSSDTRSVNTQTPLGDTLSSDDGSQSTSPEGEGGAGAATSASPRINKFLAREPPDGCEKVSRCWPGLFFNVCFKKSVCGGKRMR